MQTLRKRTSPCKYKNEPSRFLGEGITFKAKLIGILEVNEARGDKMCQDALNDLKTAIRAAGEHKQRITISIAIDGLRLRDEKSGDSMYHHPVHKISFIAQDMSDSRAFGYIFGSPDTGHRFFGIKTDKTASQVVMSMRDLFQVVFELKKKEIEMAKHHIEQHQIKYGGDEPDGERVKTKHPPALKTTSINSTTSEVSVPTPKANTSEAIADLLDLEHELNSIQQGINQMERITPSDPFGPLSKGDPFGDHFDEKQEAAKNKNTTEEVEKPTSLFSSGASSSKSHFFSQFSPSISKTKMTEESHWFDQETESLFDDAVTVNSAEPTSSPVTFHTPTAEAEPVPVCKSPTTQPDGSDQGDVQNLDEKGSPKKADVFTDLDPLGTGRVKPYVDKKDFFQELKNPPKKVLKELISETSVSENTHYFPASFDGSKTSVSTNGVVTTKESFVVKNPLASTSSNLLNSFPTKESTASSKYSRIDPFDDADPFEKADPFEESFPQSIGFPPLFSSKTSFDSVFQDKISSRYDKVLAKERKEREKEEPIPRMSPPKSSIFSAGMSSLHGPLRVSLPPEKSDTSTPLSISTITSKFRSSPSPPEESKVLRRRYYQTLKHSNDDRNDESGPSPTHDDTFYRRSPKLTSPKAHNDRKSPFKEKSYSIRSPPPKKFEKPGARISASSEFLDYTPDPPPRPKASTLFTIKPPPLPPKKQNQPVFKPPARPPSLEEYSSTFHYDYLKNQEETSTKSRFELKDPPKSPRSRHNSASEKDERRDLKKQNSDLGNLFPILPPPPQRKSPGEPNKGTLEMKKTPERKSPTRKSSSVTITINQLDQSGLENLAATLGLPAENIYNMTLQELTKRLAQKYLGPSESVDTEAEPTLEASDSFKADFEANFNTSDEPKKESPPPFDKYAVFKELIESETKKTDEVEEESSSKLVSEISEEKEIIEEEVKEDEEVEPQESSTSVLEAKEDGEDKYAALRQLCLTAQKSENLSEDMDVSNEDDSSARADNISDIIHQHVEGNFTPVTNLVSDSPIAKEWPNQAPVSEEADKETSQLPSAITEKLEEKGWGPSEGENVFQDDFDPQNSNFVVSNETDTKPTDNWATFEKPVFEDAPKQKPQIENQNENSPSSSDGKEDIKEVPFDWKPKSRGRRPNDVPWRDDDESWDEHSPKESYWSDDSSHDDNSPEKRDEDRYSRRMWNKHPRMKGPQGWVEKDERGRRDKWQEDTEDEYEESWRRRRCRVPSCDDERKWENDYECYDKGWCNSRGEAWEETGRTSRGEPWEETGRYARGAYTERRKRSESDDDYRRRCDSDASDREYVWSFKRGYTEGFGRSEKQNYYVPAPYQSSHWPEHCHEPRKSKRESCHKRPSSASETKRSYEKMYSPVDHIPRAIEKTPAGKRDATEDEFSTRYHHKDSRYHYSMDPSRHYNSYDRRSQPVHGKRLGRAKRHDSAGSIHKEVFSPSEKIDEPDQKGYFPQKTEEEPKIEKKPQHFQFEDDFIPSGGNRIQNKTHLPQQKSDSPRKKIFERDDWGSQIKGERHFSTDNNNQSLGHFGNEVDSSPKRGRDKEDIPSGVLTRPHLRGKNHFSILNRQDSNTSLRKSESINIFSRENDPFEDDEFFSSGSSGHAKLNKFSSEKSKSNSNVSDPFTWKEVFGEANFHD